MYNELRNPFFDIVKEPIKTESGALIPNKVALMNRETSDVLGIVSPNYEVVTNKQISSLFENAIELDGIKNVEVSDHLDSITKRWRRRFTISDDRLTFDVNPKVGDLVNVCLDVFNGYDGRTAYGYELIGNRLWCTNGCTTGEKMFTARYTHYSGNAEQLASEFEMKFGLFEKKVDTWRKWTTESFSFTQFKMFVESEERKYIGPKISEAIVGSYHPLLQKQKLQETKWGAFNVLTWLATHETNARKGSNVFSAKYNNINRLANEFYEI